MEIGAWDLIGRRSVDGPAAWVVGGKTASDGKKSEKEKQKGPCLLAGWLAGWRACTHACMLACHASSDAETNLKRTSKYNM
jgi:hypothetical protein